MTDFRKNMEIIYNYLVKCIHRNITGRLKSICMLTLRLKFFITLQIYKTESLKMCSIEMGCNRCLFSVGFLIILDIAVINILTAYWSNDINAV